VVAEVNNKRKENGFELCLVEASCRRSGIATVGTQTKLSASTAGRRGHNAYGRELQDYCKENTKAMEILRK
jgi:hypothetical protein